MRKGMFISTVILFIVSSYVVVQSAQEANQKDGTQVTMLKKNHLRLKYKDESVREVELKTAFVKFYKKSAVLFLSNAENVGCPESPYGLADKVTSEKDFILVVYLWKDPEMSPGEARRIAYDFTTKTGTNMCHPASGKLTIMEVDANRFLGSLSITEKVLSVEGEISAVLCPK